MATIELQSRIQSKQDTELNWTNNNPVLLNGETVISLQSDGTVRKKTGNGVSTYTQLVYDDEYVIQNAADQVSAHNTSSNPHTNMGWITNNELESAVANKADKTVPSAAGNVALLSGTGDLQDSGKSIDEIGAQSTVQTVTLTTSGWTQGSDGRYSQTVSVPGMTADAAVVTVDIAITTQDTDAMVEIMSAWSTLAVSNGVQGNGTLTIYGFGLPTVNIPINVGVS